MCFVFGFVAALGFHVLFDSDGLPKTVAAWRVKPLRVSRGVLCCCCCVGNLGDDHLVCLYVV